MKKFTIITKDGSKWLRTESPYNPETEPASTRWFHEEKCPDLLYIGNHPEGTTLDESDVKEVIQWKFHFESDWRVDPIDESEINYADMEARTAYTDAEPPDIDYEKEMPHKQWPSTKYVARPADAESHNLPAFDEILNNTSDDAKMNVSLQMDLNYWKRRCEAAERFIAKSPCDPDITKNQNAAYDAWQEIVKQQPK